MDFRYPAEAEAFRKEFRAWLDANLPPELAGDGLGGMLDGHRRRSTRAAAGVEPHARRRTLRRDRLARGMGRPGRGRDGTGRLRGRDAPRPRAGHPQPARPFEHRTRDHRARHRGAEGGAPPPHAARRRHLVPGLLRAQRRFRPRVAALLGGARRRQLDRQRPKDVEHARPPRELVRAARAHRHQRAEAQGHHVPARRHDVAGRRGPAARDDHRREGVQRDLLHRRPRPRRRDPRTRSTKVGGSR